MPYFARANAQQHDTNPYKTAAEQKKFDQIRSVFPIDLPLPTSGLVEDPMPIFVIGQPRSGTTLMEMMLSSVSNVAGCGELHLGKELSQPIVEGGTPFDDASARGFAKAFRDLMPPIPKDATAFVDKMPHNYQLVGFLLAAFPNAKVINMLRDPRDVGLSKWIRMFPAPEMRYSSNLTSIAHSANLYRKYINHWEKLFGDRLITIRYEQLVADPENVSRDVADFCGIEWNASMMQPEKNTKQVRTASMDQVRKKISTKSIGSWRAVAAHIKPMLDGFDPDLWLEYNLG